MASNNGDFWWTRIVDRGLLAEGPCDSVIGENDAIVGGFGSLVGCRTSSFPPELLVEDIASSQGVSLCHS